MTPFDYIRETNDFIFNSILSLGEKKKRRKVVDILPPETEFNEDDEEDEYGYSDDIFSYEDGDGVEVKRYLKELELK